jgi:hypothetical protein
MAMRSGWGSLGSGLAPAILVVLSSASSARAEPPPAAGDVVTLKNGGIVRGTIVEAVPGKDARVQLVTGEITTIPWADVARIATADGALPRAAASAPPPLGAAGGEVSLPAVRLHVDAPADLRVYGRQGEASEWAPMCSGPCDKLVPVEWEYQVRSEGVRPSAPFLLEPAPGGRVSVKVDPATTRAVVLGMIGVIGGGVVTATGLILWGVGAVGQYTTYDNEGNPTTRSVGSAVEPTGIVLTAAGLACIVVGGLTVLNNLTTSVKHEPGPSPIAKAPPPTAPRPEFARRAEAPAVTEMPLLKVTF